MKFSLRIAEEFPLDVRLRLYGQEVTLELVAERIDAEALQGWADRLAGPGADEAARQMMHAVLIDWHDCALVEMDGKPAAFSEAALDFLLEQPGMLDTLCNAYAQACRATWIPDGRRKNSVS